MVAMPATATTMASAPRAIAEESPVPFREIAEVKKLAGSDLETIVLKAPEKDPARRYQSANALAEDIERFQTIQPILARPRPRSKNETTRCARCWTPDRKRSPTSFRMNRRPRRGS